MSDYRVDDYLEESAKQDKRKLKQIAGVGIAGILIILFACVSAIAAIAYTFGSFDPEEYRRQFVEECHASGGRVSYSSRGEYHCIEPGLTHE